jgi:hypothetical protein
MARPEAALAFATGDAIERERAWETLETAVPRHMDATNLGELEPTACRRG